MGIFATPKMSSQENTTDHLDSILDDAVEELDLCEPIDSIDTSYLDKIQVIQETVTEFPYDLTGKNEGLQETSSRVFEIPEQDDEYEDFNNNTQNLTDFNSGIIYLSIFTSIGILFYIFITYITKQIPNELFSKFKL